MNAIEHLFTQPVAQAIGWALLQFVWQGTVVGIISAAALFALRRSAPDVRYVVATIGLSLMLTLPVVSAVQAWRTTSVGPAGYDSNASASAAPDAGYASTSWVPEKPQARVGPPDEGRPATIERRDSRIASDSMLPLVLLVWLCGVSVLSLRLMSGWLWIRRITTRGTSPASYLLQEIALRLSRSLHIRRAVTFLESTLVEVPTVVGWLKPVVIVPASVLAALTPAQLEAIIAHELAHIRRHDYLVNLLQTLVETLLFYHPAVWWLSRRIRIERENCCDDLAVSLCGDAVVYARALADLEVLRGGGGLALAASGGSLVHRVRRLLGAPSHAGRGPGWLAGTVAVLVIAGIGAGAVGNAAFTAAQATATTSQSAATTPAPAVEPAVAVATTAPVVAASTESKIAPARPAIASTRVQASVTAVTPPARATTTITAAIADSVPVEAATSVEAPAPTAAATVAAPALAPTAARSTAAVQKGNFIWTNDNEKVEIEYNGRIEFSDDDTDVKALSPNGWLRIRDGRLPNRRSVEFEADASGNVKRQYWVGTSERPFEPEGRQWLAQTLPRFIRQSGIGAADRTARLLRTKGVDGVLAEIQLIEGSWAKRLYFSELLKTGNLQPQAIEQILARAGREIDSDFELASLLIGAADRLLVTAATRRAFFDAARSIQSDFEMRRTYAAALQRGAVSSEILTGILEASTAIESDFEHASLLTQVVKLQPLEGRSRPAFFKAIASVDSDFEHRRVLDALAARTDLDADTVTDLLASATRIESDFEAATLLLTLLKQHSIEGPSRDAFFRAVDSLGSQFERGRVLQAVAKRTDASPETILAILRATKPMGGSFETSQVLMTVAARHPLRGEARDLYIDVAERLGEFEQGRALSALLKNERANAK